MLFGCRRVLFLGVEVSGIYKDRGFFFFLGGGDIKKVQGISRL